MRALLKLLHAKTVLVIACAVAGVAATLPARADEAVRAVWHVQDIYLPYFGLTTHYSCDGLDAKMRGILEKLQVREGFVVTVQGCIELSGPTRDPTVRMMVASPVPADSEQAKSFAADPKRAELIARMQKKSKVPFSDEPFDAVLKRVTLRAKDRYAGEMGTSGDCELLEQLHRFVLPKLGAKVVDDRVSCTPHQANPGNPSLEIELLVAVPAKS